MIPDDIFYPLMGIFVVCFFVLIALVDRGMNKAEKQSPGAGAITATIWLIIGLLGIPASCLIAMQLSGYADVLNVLFGG